MKYFLIVTLLSVSVFSNQEKIGFSESNFVTSNPFDKMDTEYDADILSFEASPREELELLFLESYFATNVGSISSNQFYRDESVVLRKEISDAHTISIERFLISDFDRQSEMTWLEWQRTYSQTFSFGLFGELAHEKRENDIGFVATWSPKPHLSHQMRYLLPDYSRNKRNDLTDNFTSDKSPNYISYSFLREADFRQYLFFFVLTPSEWNFPDQNKTYQHWEGGVKYLFGASENTKHNISGKVDANYRKTIETDSLLSNPIVRIQINGKLRIDYAFSENPWFDSLGFFESYRSYSENGFRGISLNHMIFLEKSLKDYGWQDWNLRFASSNYRAYGDSEILGQQGDSIDRSGSDLQSKIDLEYFIVKRKDLQWHFSLTFDVEKFGGEETWEGGHSRLMFTF
ncbi:MAG: hypothetical protein AB8E15_01705 [Bdellovibrionales bacterium]